MSRQRISSPSVPTGAARFGGPSAPTRFSWDAWSDVVYDYWAPGLHPTTGRRRRGRSLLNSDVLPVAQLEDEPRYYAVGWQALLWLTIVVLVLLIGA